MVFATEIIFDLLKSVLTFIEKKNQEHIKYIFKYKHFFLIYIQKILYISYSLILKFDKCEHNTFFSVTIIFKLRKYCDVFVECKAILGFFLSHTKKQIVIIFMVKNTTFTVNCIQ